MFEDVTAKRQAELAALNSLAALERLNYLKSEFVSVVSHEFRTALTGIQGFSEIIRDEDLSREDVKEFATDINNDALRLNRMITEMLDLDRIESGRMTLTAAFHDVNEICREAVGRAQAATEKHRLALDLDPTLPPVNCDGDRITQVISNLLSNAIKYSPLGGEITLRSRHDTSVATFSVSDQGVGLPAEGLSTVFERYERYADKMTDKVVGTGLGLPIARQIVEMHGGKIGVESMVGKGSTFWFNLPLGRRVESTSK
jgi:signal transduction histidine kinase